MSAWNDSTRRVKATLSPAAASGTRATIAASTGVRGSAFVAANVPHGHRGDPRAPGCEGGRTKQGAPRPRRDRRRVRQWRGDSRGPTHGGARDARALSLGADRPETAARATETFSPFAAAARAAVIPPSATDMGARAVTRETRRDRRTPRPTSSRSEHRATTMRPSERGFACEMQAHLDLSRVHCPVGPGGASEMSCRRRRQITISTRCASGTDRGPCYTSARRSRPGAWDRPRVGM